MSDFFSKPYLRQRENLIRSAASHIQRLQKTLTQMNLQLHKVISDVTGVTGLNIIRAIIAGERNPKKLAQLADRRIKSSPAQIEAALTGNYREEMVFILHQELSLYEFYQQQIGAIDAEIEQCLAKFPSVTEEPPPPSVKKNHRRKTHPPFDLHGHLYRITGVDLTTIDGLDVGFFGLCYAMYGGYKGWNPYIERHLAIFVNCFLSRAN